MVQQGDAKSAEVAENCNRISDLVIGSAIEVHRCLGPGLIESAYEDCLCRELSWRNVQFVRQAKLPIVYKGSNTGRAIRPDLIVEGLVLIELKAVECVSPLHRAQLLTYLRLSGRPLGLIINFNTTVLWRGVRRVVNRL